MDHWWNYNFSKLVKFILAPQLYKVLQGWGILEYFLTHIANENELDKLNNFLLLKKINSTLNYIIHILTFKKKVK